MTMKTGAIQAGIAPDRRRGCEGRERLMIPILMIVFALGGTTFGMAEESLAFYVLVITVMIAAGLRRADGRRDPAARLRHRRPRLDDQPVRHRHRLGFAGVSIDEGLVGRLVILVVGHGDRDLVRDALRRPGQGGPDRRRWSAD